MNRYEIVRYWSDEDQAFIAEFLNRLAVAPTAQRHRRQLQMPKS